MQDALQEPNVYVPWPSIYVGANGIVDYWYREAGGSLLKVTSFSIFVGQTSGMAQSFIRGCSTLSVSSSKNQVTGSDR